MPSKYNPDTSFYRRPSITAFNRLVPVPVSINYDQNLRAEVHDPLWFAARQWQMGEYNGEDAGAPAFAKITSSQAEPKAVRTDPNPLVPAAGYNYRQVPLEVLVEREPVMVTVHMRVQAGYYFQKLLRARNLMEHLPLFIDNFPLPISNLPEWDVDAIQLLGSTRANTADGILIATDLASQQRLENWIKSKPALLPAADQLLAAAGDLLKWLSRTYPSRTGRADLAHSKAWKTEQLEYGLSLELKDEATGQMTQLRSDRYADGQLDWPDFTWAGGAVLPNAKAVSETFIPTPVHYQGMPKSRYWEMEEGRVNFGNVSISPSNILSMAFAEFGLTYSNDWFWMPMPLKINSICRIDQLELTSVFGDKTTYSPPVEASGDPLTKFSLFQMLADGNVTMPVLYLPPTIAKVQEALPLEQVYFMRDEQSNLAWAVETVVPSASQRGIAMKTVSPPPGNADDPTRLVYKLGNIIPENWTPFVPVRMSGGEMRLQRAQMPGAHPAKGQILQDKAHGTPYFIREEEVSRTGIVIERAWQRTRWLNGKTFTWIGRKKTAGRFEGSSGLSWDQARWM